MSLKTQLTPLGGPVPTRLVPALCTGNGYGTVSWSTQTNEQYKGGATMSATEFGCIHGGKISNQNTVVFTLATPVKSEDGNWIIDMRFTSMGNGYTRWFTLAATYTDGTGEQWISVNNVAYYNTATHHSFYTNKTVKTLTMVSYVINTRGEYYNAGQNVCVHYNKRVAGR